MGGTEMSYMQEAYDSNWIAPLGPNVTAFEEALEKYGSEGSGKNLPFSSLSEDLKKKEEDKE